MDPGRPKFQSSRNQMKLAPLCMARCVDFDGIYFLKNGHRMRKLSRSELFPKQGKSQLVKGCTTDVADDVSSTSY
jgi:hypothetical protein